MDLSINLLATGAMFLTIGYLSYQAFGRLKTGVMPSHLPSFLVPIDVNKQRSFVNKTSDAGMAIEASRRRAIIAGHRYNSPTRAFWHKHSGNGAFEYYNLTSVCPAGECPKTVEQILQQLPPVLDPGGAEVDPKAPVLDAGGASVNPFAVLLDLGGALLNL